MVMEIGRRALCLTKQFAVPNLQRFRGFCTAAAQPSSSVEELVSPVKRNTRTNLFEVAKKLPNWGIGCTVAKRHWAPRVFWKIVRVKLYTSGRHGRAWGIFHRQGSPRPKRIRRVGGANKPVWKFVSYPSTENITASESKAEIIF